MTRTFSGKDAERLFQGYRVRRYQSIEHAARKSFRHLSAAASLNDLRAIPELRLEKLPEYGGKYGIRINKQWRILFRWEAPDACDVEIRDYHA